MKLFILFLFFQVNHGDDLQNKKVIEPDFDFNLFKADSGKSILEMDIGIPKKYVKYYSEKDSVLYANFNGYFLLNEPKTKQEKRIDIQLKIIEKKTEFQEINFLVTRLAQKIPKGEFEAEIMLNNETVSIKRKFLIDAGKNRFSDSEIGLSDIQPAFSVEKSSEVKSAFYKNGLEVIPSPALTFDGRKPLWFYAEVYNLIQQVNKDGRTLYQHSYLTKNEKMLPKTERQSVRKRSGDNVVICEYVEAANLVSGGYTYTLEIMDSAGKSFAKRHKKIFIYNPHAIEEKEYLSVQNQGSDDGDDLYDDVRRYVEYIMSNDEKKEYDLVKNAGEKRFFFERFWAKRGGAGYRSQYIALIEEANIKFSTKWRRGFQTDQGRIFIKYGNPSNIERTNDDSESRPFEIWSYENLSSQGLVFFVFADRAGLGNYELVHSTALGEITNPNWRVSIRVTR
jgi:GWxTD domain-containing protein